jgi:hypothetical protein
MNSVRSSKLEENESMSLDRCVLLMTVYAAAAIAQTTSPAPDPARIEQEIARARDEKWPMIVAQLTSGQYVAFDPTRLKTLAGNHVTLGRSAGWAHTALASTDEERIYFVLTCAMTFVDRPCPAATFMVTKATEFEVARILPPPPLLDPGPGANRKEWVGTLLNKFGLSGYPVVQVIVQTRKGAPKAKYDSLLVHLINRGSTGLAPEMEAAFMDTMISSRAKGPWKVFQTPPENLGEGTVLDMRVRMEVEPFLESTASAYTNMAVAYIAVDRATGEVRVRAFGMGQIGNKKTEKDVRSLAESCWLPDPAR